MIIYETSANQSDLKRFEEKIMPEPNTGCWIWMGAMLPTGYGRFKLKGRSSPAHRVSHSLYKGDVLFGTLVCHTCDNKWCVNPDHLYIGTHSENVLDSYRRNRMTSKKGTDHSMSKLKNNDIIFIRASLSPRKLLANQFNVTVSNIQLIQTRKLWRHI